MKKLGKVICSSVIRSTEQGESHGGLYIVDLDENNFSKVIDWNIPGIDWGGRGADRGLRGIAFYEEKVICAASDEIFFYDQEFKLVKSFKNRYLKHCHEIVVKGNFLYLTSTGFDSILEFDLNKEIFTKGFCFRRVGMFDTVRLNSKINKLLNKVFVKIQKYVFDPTSISGGPYQRDTHHINNVFVKNDEIYFSGTGLEFLFKIINKTSFVKSHAIPRGTHNVQFYNEHLVFNNTKNDVVTVKHLDGNYAVNLPVKKYDPDLIINSDIPTDHARQGFGRGLCLRDDLLIVGSSPSTITVYDIKRKKIMKSINLTMDVRNSIHGLEIFPFS